MNVLLGVTGGIAAYKSAEILRQLQQENVQVRVIMTVAAKKFIGSVTLQALSGHPVYDDMYTSSERVMEHIDLARWADAILVAPATADFIARLNHGNANDLLSTTCLAANCPIFVAPAMNHEMWNNPATQNNISGLISRGISIIEPESGEQACGENGMGRLANTLEICHTLLQETQTLSGKTLLITAGPTREALDPVRYISNHSSGKMGYALAVAAKRAGANVILISGKVNLSPPSGINVIHIESAMEMAEAVNQNASHADIFVSTAAVADYRPTEVADNKIKKNNSDEITLTLKKNPDILTTTTTQYPKLFAVGFAAETENLIKNATSKLENKKLDMIIANHVGKSDKNTYIGFNSNDNSVTVITKNKTYDFEKQAKPQLAQKLINLIVETYEKKHST